MIHNLLSQFQANWIQDVIDFYFGLNVIAQGARVMGWSKFADELTKIEMAIKAMVDAILNRNQTKTGV